MSVGCTRCHKEPLDIRPTFWPVEGEGNLCSECLIAVLRKRVAKLETERDLAVAHDRQPYPTAAAYEAHNERVRKLARLYCCIDQHSTHSPCERNEGNPCTNCMHLPRWAIEEAVAKLKAREEAGTRARAAEKRVAELEAEVKLLESEGNRLWKDFNSAWEKANRRRKALEAAGRELGVPQPGYPAPVANAAKIIAAALAEPEPEKGGEA